MKKTMILVFIMALVLVLSACNNGTPISNEGISSESTTPTYSESYMF